VSQHLPPRDQLIVQFAHPTYRFQRTAENCKIQLKCFQTWNFDETWSNIEAANVLVISGLWRNELLNVAPNLLYVQSISAGTEQYSLESLQERGIRLCSASGVNADAVSHHAIGLILSLARQLHLARDNQNKSHWRPGISEQSKREIDLRGKTLLIVGLGNIGSRIATIASTFGMKVIGLKNRIEEYEGVVKQVCRPNQMNDLLSVSDFVVLCCPLTDATRNLIDKDALSNMKESGYLVNVARGACVDEDALLSALEEGQIAGAAIDHFLDEPLPTSSAFWKLNNVVITPHSAGETANYEESVIEILVKNIEILYSDRGELTNQVL